MVDSHAHGDKEKGVFLLNDGGILFLKIFWTEHAYYKHS